MLYYALVVLDTNQYDLGSQILDWLFLNVGNAGVVAILLLLLFLWLQRQNYNSLNNVNKARLEDKDAEIKRVVRDRDYYKQIIFDKRLVGSSDPRYSELYNGRDVPAEKRDGDDIQDEDTDLEPV